MSMYGKKFTCPSCGCKFYDLNKPRVVCPRCGAEPKKHSKSGSHEGHAKRKRAAAVILPPEIDEIEHSEERIGGGEFPTEVEFTELPGDETLSEDEPEDELLEE